MTRKLLTTVACLGLAAATAHAGSHTWDVSEVFSNADGTIQFIELFEANGTPNEIGLGGHTISSTMTGNMFTIPSNVASPTSNRHFLMATADFAALPGAPTPDVIIPAGVVPFFDINGDTVSYVPWDSFTFGAVPTDGIMSMNDGGIIAPNTPTNYAGDTATVNANIIAGDFDGDGDVDAADFNVFSQCFGGSLNPPAPTCPDGVDADLDDDGDVDTLDFVLFSQNYTGSL